MILRVGRVSSPHKAFVSTGVGHQRHAHFRDDAEVALAKDATTMKSVNTNTFLKGDTILTRCRARSHTENTISITYQSTIRSRISNCSDLRPTCHVLFPGNAPISVRMTSPVGSTTSMPE